MDASTLDLSNLEVGLVERRSSGPLAKPESGTSPSIQRDSRLISGVASREPRFAEQFEVLRRGALSQDVTSPAIISSRGWVGCPMVLFLEW
jgi:hypothetical protein